MKITKEIIETSKDDSPKKLDQPQTSHFGDMLRRHIDMARQKVAEQPKGTPANQKSFPFSETAPKGKDKMAHLDKLQSMDAGYFEKASQKKTLAESYSSRFGTKTEERIEKFKPLIESKAKKYGLEPSLLAALVRQESNFNPYAVSGCGAMGLGQLMPETARYLGVKDPFNAAQNLEGAAKYLSQMMKMFGGNVDKALAAYNAGPGAVKKYGGVPPYSETQHYVRAIRSHQNYMVKNEFFELNSDKNAKKV